MPKIIENVRERLLAEARRQIAKNGYAKTTIRSVAHACGIGIGTVYNYFKSKDILIASFMAEDWLRCLEQVRSRESTDARSVLESVFSALRLFSQSHQDLLCDHDAAKVFAAVFSERHKQLRDQLAQFIRPLCGRSRVSDQDFLADFIAESLLTWTVAGRGFEDQYQIISRLLD